MGWEFDAKKATPCVSVCTHTCVQGSKTRNVKVEHFLQGKRAAACIHAAELHKTWSLLVVSVASWAPARVLLNIICLHRDLDSKRNSHVPYMQAVNE